MTRKHGFLDGDFCTALTKCFSLCSGPNIMERGITRLVLFIETSTYNQCHCDEHVYNTTASPNPSNSFSSSSGQYAKLNFKNVCSSLQLIIQNVICSNYLFIAILMNILIRISWKIFPLCHTNSSLYTVHSIVNTHRMWNGRTAELF